ncbi:uncharacterized protein [Dermacentor albipictus]|uniref:uncharacterized protein n=1 Tax=Dermacentor albipictus TaxID=60249 RepID=UPI0038FD3B4D
MTLEEGQAEKEAAPPRKTRAKRKPAAADDGGSPSEEAPVVKRPRGRTAKDPSKPTTGSRSVKPGTPKANATTASAKMPPRSLPGLPSDGTARVVTPTPAAATTMPGGEGAVADLDTRLAAAEVAASTEAVTEGRPAPARRAPTGESGDAAADATAP